MPEQLQLYMVKRSRESGYGSVSEYIRQLVRADQERYLAGIEKEVERERTYRLQQMRGRY